MISAPLVSAVIPVFNGEQTITRALESVFAQTFSGFEVIVVDDGSSDRTIDVIARYGDRLKIIRSTENRGAAAARNKGIAEARGDTFKNPVTGEEHNASIVLPDGLIWTRGECGQGSFKAKAGDISLDFKNTNWILYDFDWTNQQRAAAA